MNYRLLVRCILMLGFAVGTPLAQEDRYIEIDEFAADIRVLPEGVTEVRETLRIDFRGSWQGLIRDISLQHKTADGRNVRLDLEVVGVTDVEGNPLRYETSRSRRVQEVKFWVPDAENAIRTAVIEYRLHNVLRFFGQIDEESAVVDEESAEDDSDDVWDELYWNVTGNDWEMPIRNARATITLPTGAENVEAWGYTGPAGTDTQDASVTVDGNVVEVRSNRSLAAGEGLTVSVVWAPGLVDRTVHSPSAFDRMLDWWPFGLPLVAFGFMFTSWRRNGREPSRGSIAVQYEPPDEMSPAELGTLVDHKAEMHDITATLVDLAVRGFLIIEEKEEKSMLGLRTTKEYHFHLRKPRAEWQDLEVHERLYLQALFAKAPEIDGPGGALELMREARQASREAKAEGRKIDSRAFMAERQAAITDPSADDNVTVKLSDLNNRFYTHLKGIRTAIYQQLIDRGYYLKRPDQVMGKYMGVGFMIAFFGFFAFIFSIEGVGPGAPLAVALGFGLAAVVVMGFGSAMRARTPAGVTALERALGFKEFLERVESDRYKRMITSPEMFERYLPHAMAFRVEQHWAAAFEDLYTSPPNWYVGTGMGTFHATTFARDLNSMTTRASTTMASSPSSSGSGGGGSSGGGSGGGGGRGF